MGKNVSQILRQLTCEVHNSEHILNLHEVIQMTGIYNFLSLDLVSL